MPLNPGCERRPAKPDVAYVPAGSRPYHVATNESWETLAGHPLVKARGWNAANLMAFNFRTTIPAEVNWYLYHKIGCRNTTRDKKNYVFSSEDRPGIVYLPEPAKQSLESTPDLRTNLWLGVGIKAGTTFGVVGIETGQLLVVSVDKPHRAATLTVSTTRLGVGLGASGGGVLVLISSMKDPSELRGLLTGDVSYSLAIGVGVKGVIESAKGAELAELLRRFLSLKPETLKKGLKLMEKAPKLAHLIDEYNGKVVDAFKAAKLPVDADEPQFATLDIPLGDFGAEIGFYHAVSEFQVEGVWTVDQGR